MNYYSIGILTVLLERDIFKNNKFNDEYNIIGDFDFFIKLSQEFEIGSMQEPLAFYRQHENNFSSRKVDIYKDELDHWINLNEKKSYFSKYSLIKQKILLHKLKIKNFFKKLFKY